MQIQDSERRRVARDVHDGLGQYLVGVKMGIDQLARRVVEDPANRESVGEISTLLNRAITETRTISHLLHPPLLDEIGLESALVVYTDGFGKRSGIDVSVSVSPELGRLDIDIETALFRVAQECLLNVHRHSHSATANVSLRRENGVIELKVQDEGVGMAVSQDPGSGGLGVGLLGIQERIRQLDGNLQIRSDSGKGTLVVATVPYRPKKDAEGRPIGVDASAEAEPLERSGNPSKQFLQN
jgi:signal transduction histidine kinase